MRYRKLGKSGIEVSAVALGCWTFAGGRPWGAQDEALSVATIHAALDAGVNFLDTAENYGDGISECVLGKALAGRRRDAVIATKFSGGRHRPEEIREACEGSLERLGTDHIDLYQIHWPNRNTPFAEQMGALERLKEEGKIRAIGACNLGKLDLADFAAAGRFETDQVAYNLLWRAIEFDIMDACVENNVGILPYSSLMQGLLTGKFRSAGEVPPGRSGTRIYSKDQSDATDGEEGYEEETFAAIDRIRSLCEEMNQPMARVALAWLLHHPSVTSVLAGARTPEQLKENVTGADLELSDDVVKQLSLATDDLKQKLGPNPDMWETESRMR